MEERLSGLSVDQIAQIGASLGYTVQRQSGDSVVLNRPVLEETMSPSNRFPVAVEVFISTGDAATYLPHPRQPAYRLFHFGAALAAETFSAVLRNPWNDLQFSYRLSEIINRPQDTVPTAPPPMTLAAALERQATVIEREIADLRTERAEIRRRLRCLHRPRNGAGDDDSDSALGASHRGASDDPLLQGAYRKEVDSLSGRDARSRHSGAVGLSTHTFEGAKSETNRRYMSSVDDYSGRAGGYPARLRDRSGFNDDDTAGGGDMSQSTVSATRSTTERTRGNKGVWALFYPDAQEEFGRCWALKSVNLVALGRGYLVSYDDGTVTWHDICPLLDTKLRQQGITPVSTLSQQGSKPSSPSAVGVRVKYLVLGEGTNFYVKFDNGRMEWCGNDTFGDTLRKGVNDKRLMVERVAFGQAGAWLVLWSDWSFDCEGLPTTLVDRLRRSAKRDNNSTSGGGTGQNQQSPRGGTPDTGKLSGVLPGIRDITVGPAGEWFIIYKDHSVQADNLPDALYRNLSLIRERSGRVRSIVFGENRSWFVRYWDGPK